MGREVRYHETGVLIESPLQCAPSRTVNSEVVPVQNQRAQCGLFTQSFQSPAIIKAFNQVKFACLCVCMHAENMASF